jgi:hypothetical protein
MRNKQTKSEEKKNLSSKKSKTSRASHPFETMSQIENRYGKGREKNGSDGGSKEGGQSNH